MRMGDALHMVDVFTSLSGCCLACAVFLVACLSFVSLFSFSYAHDDQLVGTLYPLAPLPLNRL